MCPHVHPVALPDPAPGSLALPQKPASLSFASRCSPLATPCCSPQSHHSPARPPYRPCRNPETPRAPPSCWSALCSPCRSASTSSCWCVRRWRSSGWAARSGAAACWRACCGTTPSAWTCGTCTSTRSSRWGAGKRWQGRGRCGLCVAYGAVGREKGGWDGWHWVGRRAAEGWLLWRGNYGL